MNYKLIYEKLINRGLKRGHNKKKLGYYTESHHIIPKCMGGSDDENNLVLLTAREHLIAHVILFKIHRLPKLMFAIHRMCGNEFPSSKKYDWMRREHANSVSKSMKALWEDESFKEKMVCALYKRHKDYPVSNETKSKMSESLKIHYQNNPVSDECRKNNSDAQKKRFQDNPQTEETKQLRRESCRKAQGTPIWRCDENGNKLEMYGSAAEAKETLGLKGNTQNIYTACKRHKDTGRLYKSAGIVWKYH